MRSGTFAIGIDVGGSKIHGVIVDHTRSVVGHFRTPMELGNVGVVSSVTAAIRNLSTQVGIFPTQLQGVGVGIPGLVDSVTGRVIHAVNLHIDDEGLDLARLLQSELGLSSVRVENDVNAAALGAADVLALDDTDLCYLSIGTGLAAGLVIHGKLLRGIAGAAGEIGHIPVDPNGGLCRCGQHGCLEVNGSGSALDRAWPTPTGKFSAAEVFAAADRGNPEAASIREKFAQSLALAVQVVVLTCDVEVVALSGGVSAIGEPLLDALRTALARNAAPSRFLSSLHLAERLRLVPFDQPVAAIGAAIVGISGKDF